MFTKRSTAIMAVLAALGMLTASFLFGFGLGRSTPQALKADLQILEEVRGQIESSAINPGEDRKLVQGAIKGMLESLEDPYASYLDPQARRSLDHSLSGHFSGVGMVLKREDKVVKVVSVLSNTPAATAGISPGDVVVTVNRKTVDKLTLDEVVQRIQGAPGTTIKLS
ncbi:MAG TPA: PDZ domain-containing protein, partial [Actinomycetota bacterium]|nr:PDZ domain-containing protein [Actinomycetota bacterium]